MLVKIENDRVRKNIELFLHLLNRFRAANERKYIQDRVYRAYINRVNGEVFFSDLLPETAKMNKSDWKMIEFRCDPSSNKLTFEISEVGGDTASFKYEELSPLACKTLADTVHMLNSCARLFPSVSDIEHQLEDLSALQIETPVQKNSYDLIHAAWHSMDRLEAENLLFNHPYGSFIFRKDEFCKLLEELLGKTHLREIKCFTLTFIEPERKICDLTIVFDSEHCLIYNDDPSLTSQSYPDLQTLLAALNDRCKYPVFH